MKWVVVSFLATVALALAGTFAGLSLAASSYSDVAGDNNEAPDVTSEDVSEPSAGRLAVSVKVANYVALPAGSWINLWFDLDSNGATGDGGDEALARYLSDGTLEFFRWNGTSLAREDVSGMTASYADGVLTFEGAASVLAPSGGFGILAVASREQQVEGDTHIAADFAPDSGRSAYAGPAPAAFADPEGDHPVAPDLTSVRVADARNGMISFTISTPNLVTIRDDMIVLLFVDADAKASTGLTGADFVLLYEAGEVQLGRWNRVEQQFLPDEPPSRVQARNAAGVLTLLVHRGELGDPTRFRFSIGAGHVGADGDFDALDIAPETLYWQYALANRPALRLLTGRAVASPARPVAGKALVVSVPVTRSDTGRRLSSASVSCAVRVAGNTVAASGRLVAGTARCSFRVPASASGKRLTGTIVVRSAGKTVSTRFGYTVR
jgi:hypothetical protein